MLIYTCFFYVYFEIDRGINKYTHNDFSPFGHVHAAIHTYLATEQNAWLVVGTKWYWSRKTGGTCTVRHGQ